MGLLSKPSRGLLLEVLQRVLEKGKCDCKTALVQCSWCDVRDVLQMEVRSPSTVIEGILIDGDKIKLKSGKEVQL